MSINLYQTNDKEEYSDPMPTDQFRNFLRPQSAYLHKLAMRGFTSWQFFVQCSGPNRFFVNAYERKPEKLGWHVERPPPRTNWSYSAFGYKPLFFLLPVKIYRRKGSLQLKVQPICSERGIATVV